jgi:predicted  nucleic acid-binding Zn-ribbon protein
LVGQLTNRVGQLENKIDRHSEELRGIREEMRNLREELREEMRRGNQQLLLALANHSHGSDGQPVFRVPVSPE